jgi:hypothetical protein
MELLEDRRAQLDSVCVDNRKEDKVILALDKS